MKLREANESRHFTVQDWRDAKGASTYRTGSFNIGGPEAKKITSLHGCPQTINGGFHVDVDHLTNLVGGPKRVTGGYDVVEVGLTSLEGAPVVLIGDLVIAGNKLTNLLHCPPKMHGQVYCQRNPLVSLEGISRNIEGLLANDTKLQNLHNIHKQIDSCTGVILLNNVPLKSHVLGVILIRGVTRISMDNGEVESIINKHLCTGMKGVLLAQEELIDAGFEAFAQL